MPRLSERRPVGFRRGTGARHLLRGWWKRRRTFVMTAFRKRGHGSPGGSMTRMRFAERSPRLSWLSSALKAAAATFRERHRRRGMQHEGPLLRAGPVARRTGLGVQRRAEFRLPVSCALKARPMGARRHGEGPWLRLKTLDLSAGGCRILDPHRVLGAGLLLCGRLDLRDDAPPLRCRVKILGARPAPDPEKAAWGATFIGLEEDGQARIRRRLHAAYRRRRRSSPTRD
ncbi:MAG: hypothetical protein GF355_15945 [Candidatus Eisenbacteria bacterium]|nr:hypothetical protein [Candidatus Eisenbacteria bacterium]